MCYTEPLSFKMLSGSSMFVNEILTENILLLFNNLFIFLLMRLNLPKYAVEFNYIFFHFSFNLITTNQGSLSAVSLTFCICISLSFCQFYISNVTVPRRVKTSINSISSINYKQNN